MTARSTTKSPSFREVLEILSETRLTLLHLALLAREAKEKDSAKDLDAKAAVLKGQIADYRRSAHGEWSSQAKTKAAQISTAVSRLRKLNQTPRRVQRLSVRAVALANAAATLINLSGKHPK